MWSSQGMSDDLHAAVAKFTPTAQVTICGGFSDLLTQRPPLDKLQRLADTQRVRRKELLSPFNFAAFYLPYVLREASRVLYLDTDAVVEADVTMLRSLDMGSARPRRWRTARRRCIST